MATLFSWSTAGSWKHKDFPDPVGIDINTSWVPVTEENLGNIHMKEWKTYNHNFSFIHILWSIHIFTSFTQVFSI
jgi:hypothetical protein